MVGVSILVPIYGVERYIERCARSLFEQTYQDIEYIFVNDCSPDESIRILQSTIKDYPNRIDHIRIIDHDHNRGLASSRNTAVDNCRTEFLMHVDSDDYIEKDTVECCVLKQLDGNYDIVSFDILKQFDSHIEYFRQGDFKDSRDYTFKMLTGSCVHCLCGNLIRTALYKDFDIKAIDGLNMGEDLLVMPKLAYNAQNVVNLHKAFYHYDFQNPESYAITFSEPKNEQVLQVVDNLLAYFSSDSLMEHAAMLCKMMTLNEGLKKAILFKKKEYYQILFRRYNELPKDITSENSFWDKMVQFIGCNPFGYLFVKAGYGTKKLFRVIKTRMSQNRKCRALR